MKRTAYIFTIIPIYLLITPLVDASSAKVNIQNYVNSVYDSNSTSQTNTKIEIHQEGEGTSSVKINGKEWKLEGPGDISVNESSDSDYSDASTSTVEKSEPLTTPTETPSPTPTEKESAEVLGESDENDRYFIGNMVENFITACYKFLARLLIFD